MRVDDTRADAEILQRREVVHEDRAAGREQRRRVRNVVRDRKQIVARVDENEIELPARFRQRREDLRRETGERGGDE